MLSRGLPYSIVLHLVVLGCIAAWGGHVPQPPVQPKQFFRVQIARMPAPQAPLTRPAAPAQAEPEVVETPSVPEPETPQQVLPPKEVPKEREKKEEPKPERTAEAAASKRDAATDGPPAADPDLSGSAVASGPAVAGTDVDFPFAWYLDRVEGIVARQWNPRQLGFREGSARSCVVHFMVDRAGQISQVTVVRGSGVSLFDREALRAVKAGRLPPLPAKFPYRALGVTFVFTLQSGV